MPRKKKELSAQVMLRSASGTAPDANTVVTADNVREYLPSSSSITEARRAFEEAGFEVGQVVGNSFSITASKSTFEKVFKVKLKEDKEKGVMSDEGNYELPTSKLSQELRRDVAVVTFTPPPDFGPTNYSY